MTSLLGMVIALLYDWYRAEQVIDSHCQCLQEPVAPASWIKFSLHR